MRADNHAHDGAGKLPASPRQAVSEAGSAKSGEQAIAPRRAVASKTGILITGMHRSGTSALARVFNLLGCDLPNTLMPAGEGNEPGHWESVAIADFNDEILASAGLSWPDWVPFGSDWSESPSAERFRERAVSLLEQEFADSRFFVLKDPRICRLLPFWLSVFEAGGYRPAIVTPTRNPLEVAASLAARDGIHPSLGHLLWLRYVLEAERSSRGRPRFYCTYDQLMHAWPQLIKGVRKSLGLTFSRMSPHVQEEIETFLGDRHRHHRQTRNSVSENPLLSTWLRDTYDVFDRWSADGEQGADHATLDRVLAEFDAAAPAFARPIALGLKAASKVKSLETELTQARADQQQNERLASEIHAQHLALADAESRHAIEVRLLQREIEAGRGELNNREQALSMLATELDRLNSELAETRGQLAHAELRFAEEVRLLHAEAASARNALESVTSKLEHDSREHALAVDAANAKVGSLKVQLEGLDSERRTLEATLDDERDRYETERSHLQKELAEARATITTLERQQEEQQAQAREGDSERVLLQGLLDEEQRGRDSDRAQFSAKLAQAEAAITVLADQRETQEKRSLEAEKTVARLAETLEAANERLAHAERTAAEFMVQRDAQEQRSLAAESTVATLTEMLKGVEKRSLEAEETVARLAETLEAANERLAHAERTAAEFMVQRDAQEQRSLAAESTVATLTEMLKGVEDRLTDADAALDERLAEIVTLTQMLRERERASVKSAEEAAALLATLRTQLMESERVHDLQRSDLQRALDAAIAGAADDRRAMLEARDRALIADTIADERSVEIATLRSRLAAQEADLVEHRDRLIAQIEDTANRLAGKERQLRLAQSELGSAKAQAEWTRQVCATLLAGGRRLRGRVALMLPSLVLRGWAKRQLKRAGLFDGEAYLEANPDVKRSGADPLRHVVHHGIGEGRWIGQKLGRPMSAHDAGANGKSVIAVQTVSLPAAPILPANTRDYWIPQTLRDYLVDTGRESSIAQVTALMDLIVAYSRHPGGIEQAPEYPYLLRWLHDLARRRASPGAPDVSIVLTAYNHVAYTLAALSAVLGSESRYSYEVLVADNCSTDGTAFAMQLIGGVAKHIRHVENLGYLRNCNTAAEQARGKYIVLLNNDTLALSGWLDNLIDPFERSEKIGLVGSKLLNSDGTLQEAGGLLWSDGSAWNFGRNQDPRLPEFSYLKDVDYVSGASIALRTEVWRKLGGYDLRYAPVYCEDSDLAFRVRDLGLRTIMNPLSEIIHHEGVTNGRDVTSGAKAHQVTNTAKFFERWRDVLERDHFPNGQEVFVARDRSRDKPHILFVDHYVPQWDKDAGSRTIWDCVRFFADSGFQVTFWSDNLMRDEPYTRQLQALGVEVIYGWTYSGKFADWWQANGRYYAHVFLSRCHISLAYIDVIRQAPPRGAVLYYGHDMTWKRLFQEFETTGEEGARFEAEKMKEMEDRICGLVDYIIYPTREECDYARANFPGAKGVIEMPAFIYEDAKLADAAEAVATLSDRPADFLFVGGFAHRPNGDGVRWFLKEVFPLVRREEPNSRFWIVGSHMPDDIRNVEIDGVHPLGWMTDGDLAALAGKVACTIAPLRFGAGVKGKVIGAFASGSPVVSTSIGLQGIDNPESVAFLGDTPQDFAMALLSCLRDRPLAAAKAAQALELVRTRYSRRALAHALMPAIGNV